ALSTDQSVPGTPAVEPGQSAAGPRAPAPECDPGRAGECATFSPYHPDMRAARVCTLRTVRTPSAGQTQRLNSVAADGDRTPPGVAGSLSPLLLPDVQLVLAQPRRIFAQLELFAASLATDRIVQVARLLASEKDNFDLFLAFGHRNPSLSGLPAHP